MTQSAERVRTTLEHRAPDRVPVDFGGTFVTGIHVSTVAALRRHYGLENGPVKVRDPGQMLGAIDDDLKAVIGIDTEALRGRMTRFGFPAEEWKPWRMYDGLEVLVPGELLRCSVWRFPSQPSSSSCSGVSVHSAVM